MSSKALLLALALACLGLASARSLKGGRHIEGPVCKWKCDEDFDAHRWEDKFDCSINQFHELNHWAKEKKTIKKGDVCDVPCEAEHKPKKDKKKWHYYGEVCQFKADKDYSKDDFCTDFGIEWLVVIALNEDWCEDTVAEVVVFKKGEIVDVPCHYEHKRHGKKWHWKPDQKRKTKGDVCEFKIVKKWHPRRVQREFDWDWEGCLELNPHLYYRKWCYVEEIIYIPCDRKHKEHGNKWHHEEKKWWCEFDRDDWKPDWKDCKDYCPGECRPRKKEYDCEEDRRPRWPETPDWCIPPQKDWGNKDDFCFRPDPVYDFTPDYGWEGEWVKPEDGYNGDGNHHYEGGNKPDNGHGSGNGNGWDTNPDANAPAPEPEKPERNPDAGAPAPQPESNVPENNIVASQPTKVDNVDISPSPSPSPSPKDDPAPVEESPEQSSEPVEPEASPETTVEESTAPEDTPVESAAPEDVPSETEPSPAP